MFGFCIMRGAKAKEGFQSLSQPARNISNIALNMKFAQAEVFVRAFLKIVYSNVPLVEKF